MKKVKDFLRHNLFAILWMLFIAIIMLLPLPASSSQLENKILDKLIHALVYGLLTIFWAYGVFRQQDFVMLRNNALWVAMIISSFYSILIEVTQVALPYRSFEILDIVSNLLGIVFAYLIMRKLIIEAKRKPQKTLS